MRADHPRSHALFEGEKPSDQGCSGRPARAIIRQALVVLERVANCPCTSVPEVHVLWADQLVLRVLDADDIVFTQAAARSLPRYQGGDQVSTIEAGKNRDIILKPVTTSGHLNNGIQVQPATPGRRFSSVSDFVEITRVPREVAAAPLHKTVAVTASGRVTSRHRGGGHNAGTA